MAARGRRRRWEDVHKWCCSQCTPQCAKAWQAKADLEARRASGIVLHPALRDAPFSLWPVYGWKSTARAASCRAMEMLLSRSLTPQRTQRTIAKGRERSEHLIHMPSHVCPPAMGQEAQSRSHPRRLQLQLSMEAPPTACTGRQEPPILPTPLQAAGRGPQGRMARLPKQAQQPGSRAVLKAP